MGKKQRKVDQKLNLFNLQVMCLWKFKKMCYKKITSQSTSKSKPLETTIPLKHIERQLG